MKTGEGIWAGGPMTWRQAGAEGPPVVLVHSSGMGARQWLRLLGGRADRWRLWAPDLVGYEGTGPWVPGSNPLPGDVGVVAALIERIGEPVHLVGHSYGATVAALVASLHPEAVRSLLVVEPVDFGLITPADGVPEMETMAAFLDPSTGGEAAWMGAFIDYWNAPGFWRAMSEAQRGALLAVGPKVFAEVTAVITGRPLGDAIGAIHVPTLVAYGGRTTPGARVMAERVHAGIAGATTACVPRAGHMFPLSRHRAFAALLDGWIGAAR